MPTALAQREQTQALEAFRARVRTDVLAAIAEHKAALRDSALSADDYNKIRRLHDDKVARHTRTRTLTRTRTVARTHTHTHTHARTAPYWSAGFPAPGVRRTSCGRFTAEMSGRHGRGHSRTA
ncbi:MAG: hypothetical protein ACPIOQ_28445 [Promethearchaeia archaeon]